MIRESERILIFCLALLAPGRLMPLAAEAAPPVRNPAYSPANNTYPPANSGQFDQPAPYQAAQYQAPPYQAAPYQAPQYQAPPYQANPYQAAQYQAPPYQADPYQAPQYQAPPYQRSQDQAMPYQAWQGQGTARPAGRQAAPIIPAAEMRSAPPLPQYGSTRSIAAPYSSTPPPPPNPPQYRPAQVYGPPPLLNPNRSAGPAAYPPSNNSLGASPPAAGLPLSTNRSDGGATAEYPSNRSAPSYTASRQPAESIQPQPPNAATQLPVPPAMVTAPGGQPPYQPDSFPPRTSGFPNPTAPLVPGYGGGPAAPTPRSPQQPAADEFEPAQILAQVGDQFILAGDLLGFVAQSLEPYRDQMTEEQHAEQKRRLTKAILKQAVETKLLYYAFLRNVPADRRAEALPKIQKSLFSEYDEKELEGAVKKADVANAAELDAKLRKYGSSLLKQKRLYMEQKLGRAAVAQNINVNPEITHQEMLDYYREHLADYEYRGKCKWEKLTVRFEKFEGKDEARRAIAALGNEVLIGGAPLSAVAKRSSQGFDSTDGGLHDWTTQGSLRSEPIDQAIFSLPPGYLSQIIEDEQGFHIVRVIERKTAGRTPFTEAQVEIKDLITQQKRQEQLAKFLAELRASVKVWTLYDDLDGPDRQAAVGAANIDSTNASR